MSGGKAAPEAVVRRGMVDLQQRLAAEFRTARTAQVEHARRMAAINAPLVEVISKEARVRAAVQALRQLDRRLGVRKLAAPRLVREEERVSLGSISATRTPPYDYPWTWSAGSGAPAISVAANRNTGQMSFSIWNASKDASGSAAAALGIYFRPVVTNGILRLSSSPAFNYSWWTYCVFASAHSDGFIGLYVGRYTLAGGFDGAPVDQRISLWSDDSWWSGAGSHSGSSSGYPLFAQLNVDSSHWYALWVWCGGRASGAGWGGLFSGSGAGSNLSVTVPSIFWELF
ncbi:MAG TPA: hypothetical protein VEK85_15155 [Gemmatimonadales bacterium]|nr:hypothetical protein [Gemmatimonadales bacterium]